MEKVEKRFLTSLVGEYDFKSKGDFMDSFNYACQILSSDEADVLRGYFIDCKSSKVLAEEKGVSELGINLDIRRSINKIRSKSEYGVPYTKLFTEGYNETLNKMNETKKKLESIKVKCQESLVKDELDRVSLVELDLSTRTYNQLSRAGYNCLGDFIGKSLKDIASIRNLGTISQKEILGKLEDFGFSF